MMWLPRVRLTVRRMVVAVAAVAVAAAAFWALLSYGARVMLRHEAAYNAERRQLHRDFAVRLQGEMDRLLQAPAEGPDGRSSADRVFEMLKLSRVANNSREVETWERAPHSSERTSVALKWGKVAVDEAAFEAALCDRWAADYERGRMPHHVTADEVPPFRMPAGWTEDDLKYGRTARVD